MKTTTTSTAKNCYCKLIMLVLFLAISRNTFSLENSFAISVNAPNLGMCNFEFYKYSNRAKDLQVFTWDGTKLTPYTPGEVRTYRGIIRNHPNYKAFAVWYPDGTLYIRTIQGKGESDESFSIDNIKTSDYKITKLNLPFVSEAMRSKYHFTCGYSCLNADFKDSKQGNGDIETQLAMWENSNNQLEYSTTRDIGLSVSVNLMIVPTSPFPGDSLVINPNDYKNQIKPVTMFWKATGSGGVAGKRNYCNGKPFQGGRAGISRRWMLAYMHELGHTLNLGHQHNQVDAQDANHFYWGRNSLAIAQEHLNQNSCLKNPSPNYTDPVHPRASEDYYLGVVNQEQTLDVLANDIDYNGDVVKIKSFSAKGSLGGALTLVGNKLKYKPLPNVIGRDEFTYVIESGSGDAYFTNTTTAFVELKDDACDLALQYSFEQTTGVNVINSAWKINAFNGKLKNSTFSTTGVQGVVGNAVDLTGEDDGIYLNDVIDPLEKDMSVSIWFKVKKEPTGNGFLFDSGARGVLVCEGLSIYTTPNGVVFKAQTESYDNTGAELYYNTKPALDKWYHAVLVVDRTANILKAYINGVRVPNSKNFDLNPNAIIKGWPGGFKKDDTAPKKYRTATSLGMMATKELKDHDGDFNGYLDEFKIFTKALTDAEVTTLYNNPLAAFNGIVEIKSTSGVTEICNNKKLVLEAGNHDNYNWSTGATTPTIAINSAGTYSITVKHGACTSTDKLVVTQGVAPTPVILTSGPLEFCKGDSVVLNAGIYSLYNWSTGEKTQKITAKISGTYSVTVSNNNGCDGSTSKIVIVKAVPSPIIVQSGNVLTVTNVSNPKSYQWYKDGVLIPGANNSSYTPTDKGNYTVEVSNTENCTAKSSSIAYITSQLEVIGNTESYQIYPVPNNGLFTIDMKFTASSKVQITVYNLLGKIIYEEQTEKTGGLKTQIDLGNHSAGMYLVKIKVNENVYISKVLVE